MTGGPPEGSAVAPSRLQEELRQNRPFRSRAQEAFLSLLRTADLAKNRFSDLFSSEDVTFQQYNVLRILRGAGPAGLPTLEIGSRNDSLFDLVQQSHQPNRARHQDLGRSRAQTRT